MALKYLYTLLIPAGIVTFLALSFSYIHIENYYSKFSFCSRDQSRSITHHRIPNCSKIFEQNVQEYAYAKEFMKRHPRDKTSPDEMIEITANCTTFISERKYMTNPTTEEEAAFPIAYVITAYIDIEYFERLLRAIYVPQNLYCIHVDLKSPQEYFDAVLSIGSCFSNIMVSSKRFDVAWGTWTQVEAHLQCMKDLVSEEHWGRWKYLINLTGHEYPMKTNFELVKALKAYQGNNDFSGSFQEGKKALGRLQVDANEIKLPFNATYAKGEIHGLFTQKFVKFILEDPKATEVTEYIKNYAFFPDESLFQILNYNKNLQAPGGFVGTDAAAHEHWVNNWPVRYKVWSPRNSPMVYPYLGVGCRTGLDRGICAYDLEDLIYIRKYGREGPHLFLNKLRLVSYLVHDCLENDFMERRDSSHLGNSTLNSTLWSDRAVVKFGRGDGLLVV